MRPHLTGAFVALRRAAVASNAHSLSKTPYSLDMDSASDGSRATDVSRSKFLALAPVLANHPIVGRLSADRASRYADSYYALLCAGRVSERPAPRCRSSRNCRRCAAVASAGTPRKHRRGVPEPALFELASLIINAVASLHAWPGGLAHGAINPAHILSPRRPRRPDRRCVRRRSRGAAAQPRGALEGISSRDAASREPRTLRSADRRDTDGRRHPRGPPAAAAASR
jgi:hypothetical protein